METEIKITEEKAYDYARPAAKTLYRQGFIKETQGWRMRFNSNSVKNSPDYVK